MFHSNTHRYFSTNTQKSSNNLDFLQNTKLKLLPDSTAFLLVWSTSQIWQLYVRVSDIFSPLGPLVMQFHRNMLETLMSDQCLSNRVQIHAAPGSWPSKFLTNALIDPGLNYHTSLYVGFPRNTSIVPNFLCRVVASVRPFSPVYHKNNNKNTLVVRQISDHFQI